MKKLISLLILVVLMTSFVLAVEDTLDTEDSAEMEDETIAVATRGMDDNSKGVGNEDAGPELYEDEVETDEIEVEPLISPGPNNREVAQTKEELKAMLQERKQEMEQERLEMPEKEQKVYMNQNTVREAVHAMLAMEELAGGIGKDVSEIARQFNNSVQATIRAEEKIQEKGGLARFFSGGDEKAAAEIEQQLEQNRARIQELNQLMEQCDCDQEVKAMLQEQIQNMEQEQNRLGELAEKEKKSKGMFGWLWK